MPLWIFSKASTPTAQAVLGGTGPMLVDEFQDTDQAQNVLLKHLAFFTAIFTWTDQFLKIHKSAC
jgi:hypothetical protein